MEYPFDPDPTDERELGRKNRLKALGDAIAEKRDEAVNYRQSSGIEDVWMYCEEAYIGIDDANRGEWQGAKWAKPTSMEGPLTRESFRGKSQTRSNVFVRLTARYVDCGAAKMGEILLPIDDKPFSFEPTPVPEMINPQASPQVMQQQGAIGQMQPGMPPAAPAPMPQPPQPAPQDLAKQVEGQAKDAAKKAEKRVYDWMVEGGFAREMRKVIHDAARIGAGVLKAPYATMRTSKALSEQDGQAALIIEQKVVPGMTWVDPWNIFPDPSCGETIHEGDFVFERDFMTPRKLKELKKLVDAGYMPDAIDKVLAEGPGKCNIDESGNPNLRQDPTTKRRRFEIYYYYGVISREDMAAANAVAVEDLKEDQQELYGILTLVNDTVIRVVINPLDSGAFPYKVMPWTRRAGSWTGIGVGEQCKEPQRIINAATRSMLNNAGRSGGIQIVMDQEAVIPADGNWEISPEKIWHKNPNSMYDDVRKAFTAVQFPNVTPQMMTIIEYAFRLAEESTNIPLVTQGQSGDTTPDTYGAAQLQNNNANQLLRSIAYTFDDCITHPCVSEMYEWLLLDPEVPADEKGDFIINAHGSSSLVERSIQDQFLLQLANFVPNPAFELSPARWMTEVLKSRRMDPRSIQLTDEEKAQMQQQPPPEAPQVTAAKIRAETDLKKVQLLAQEDQQKTSAMLQQEQDLARMENETEIHKIAVDTDRDAAWVQAQHEANMAEHQARMAELTIKRELAMLDYANKRQVSLDQIKSDLARDAAKLQLQRELAGASHAVDLHKYTTPQVATPAVEPAGRAPNGQAFQK